MVVIYLTNKVCTLAKKTSSWTSLIALSSAWRWCSMRTRKGKKRSMCASTWVKRNNNILKRHTSTRNHSTTKTPLRHRRSEKMSRKIIKPKTPLRLKKMILPSNKQDKKCKKCFLIRQLKKVRSKMRKKISMIAIILMKVLKSHKKNTKMVIFQFTQYKTKTQKLKSWQAGATLVKNNSAL